MSQPRSSGRGGAGNISQPPTTLSSSSSTNPSTNPSSSSSSSSAPTAADLATPTIKAPTYTTGRGGSGNMATNDPLRPQVARAAQDVDAPAAHSREPRGTFHWGRGGEGNMVYVGGSDGKNIKNNNNGGGNGVRGGNDDGNNTNNNNNEKVEGTGSRASAEGRAQVASKPQQRRTESSRESLGAALKPRVERRGSLQEALDKGREMFGLKKEERKKKVPESAIED